MTNLLGAFPQNKRALLSIFFLEEQTKLERGAWQASCFLSGTLELGGTSLHLNGAGLDGNQDSGGRGSTSAVINRAAMITAREGF